MRAPMLAAGAAAALLVPVLVLYGQSTKEQPHGNLALDCAECHLSETWTPLAKPLKFRHDSTGFALQSAHAQVSCRDCHRTLEFNQVGTACVDCHEDAHRGEMGTSCEACHTPTTWTNQREMSQVHNRTRLPLFAAHSRLDCTACHKNQEPYQYKTTPAECGNCHLPTYLRTTNPNHVQSGFSRRCEDCHNVTSPTWRSARFSHPESFPLAGGHAALACARCHAGGSYAGTPSACVSCHQATYAATTNPSHVAGHFPTSCESCHTIASWRPAKFDHDSTRFPLTGAHGRTDCARCHANGQYAGTPTSCAACHQPDYDRTTNPNHKASGFPTQCQNCHNTGAWRPANFDHQATRFPLTGAHNRTDCAKCHVGGRYAGTPTDCNSCHQANYAATTNPNHQASGFPVQCQSCHNTSAWRPATVDHSKTRFPLTGAHQRVDCARCHTGGRYTGTPTDCYSCHQANYAGTTNPNHQASAFPTQCQTCHSTSAWRPATVDHSKTRFPLTGAHTRVDCARCHVNGRYTGTPTDCNSCHQADYAATTNPNHRSSGFPVTCRDCHSTNAWRPATFDHDGRYFPIYSGAHRGKWSSCSECHVSSGNYKVFECILCHQHSNKAKVDSDHKGEKGYVYASSACYQCHRNGRADLAGGLRRQP
jgi:hypothetical protein